DTGRCAMPVVSPSSGCSCGGQSDSGGSMVVSRRRLVDDQPTNFRFHPRVPLGRVSLAMVLSLLASLGCGGSSSEPKSDPTPKPHPPARLLIGAPPPDATGA